MHVNCSQICFCPFIPTSSAAVQAFIMCTLECDCYYLLSLLLTSNPNRQSSLCKIHLIMCGSPLPWREHSNSSMWNSKPATIWSQAIVPPSYSTFPPSLLWFSCVPHMLTSRDPLLPCLDSNFCFPARDPFCFLFTSYLCPILSFVYIWFL